MQKLTSITSKSGKVDIYTNQQKSILHAIPSGYISPDLVKKDLQFLKEFDQQSHTKWKYVVDISNVDRVHPKNPFLLKGLKQLTKMSDYVVYCPSTITRLMIKMTSWINSPDRILKTDYELQSELNKT